MSRQRVFVIVVTLLVLGSALLMPAVQERFFSRPTPPSTPVDADFPVTVTDDLNCRVTIATRPTRIVSLSPAATEMLYAIGAGSLLIAVAGECDYPPAVRTLPKVGSQSAPNITAIAALKPALILIEKESRPALLKRLPALCPVIAIAPNSVEDVIDSAELLGKACGVQDMAAVQVTEMMKRKEALTARLDAVNDRVPTLFLLAPNSLQSVGNGTHIDAMIRQCGGQNIAATSGTPWPTLTMETVVKIDPTVILLVETTGVPGALTTTTALARFRSDKHWKTVNAVRKGRVYVLDECLVMRPGPRILDGVEAMARALHPEAFSKPPATAHQ